VVMQIDAVRKKPRMQPLLIRLCQLHRPAQFAASIVFYKLNWLAKKNHWTTH
jgi:hypothetical protein